MRQSTRNILGLCESLNLAAGSKWIVVYPDGSKEHAVLLKPFMYGGKTSYELEFEGKSIRSFFLTKDGKRLMARLGYRGKEGTAYATPA